MAKRRFNNIGNGKIVVSGTAVASNIKQETKTPSIFSSDTASYGGGLDWDNPANAGASDGSYATFSSTSVYQYTGYLKGLDGHFSIPGDATITGIMVQIERHADNFNSVRFVDSSLVLFKNGVLAGDDKYDSGTLYPSDDTVATYGGPSDLWGITWNPADVNATDFGVGLAVFPLPPCFPSTVYVNTIQITVYFI